MPRFKHFYIKSFNSQWVDYEHNFGHGYKTLSNIFADLMLLAFLVDQCLEAVNLEFKLALKKYCSCSNLFVKCRMFFTIFTIKNYEALYAYMLNGPPKDRWTLS